MKNNNPYFQLFKEAEEQIINSFLVNENSYSSLSEVPNVLINGISQYVTSYIHLKRIPNALRSDYSQAIISHILKHLNQTLAKTSSGPKFLGYLSTTVKRKFIDMVRVDKTHNEHFTYTDFDDPIIQNYLLHNRVQNSHEIDNHIYLRETLGVLIRKCEPFPVYCFINLTLLGKKPGQVVNELLDDTYAAIYNSVVELNLGDKILSLTLIKYLNHITSDIIKYKHLAQKVSELNKKVCENLWRMAELKL